MQRATLCCCSSVKVEQAKPWAGRFRSPRSVRWACQWRRNKLCGDKIESNSTPSRQCKYARHLLYHLYGPSSPDCLSTDQSNKTTGHKMRHLQRCYHIKMVHVYISFPPQKSVDVIWCRWVSRFGHKTLQPMYHYCCKKVSSVWQTTVMILIVSCPNIEFNLQDSVWSRTTCFLSVHC